MSYGPSVALPLDREANPLPILSSSPVVAGALVYRLGTTAALCRFGSALADGQD